MRSKFHYDFSLLPPYIDELFDKMNIGVVFGGDSSQDGAVIHKTHNPRPWKSYEVVANDIADTLKRIGFKHVYLLRDDMTLIENLKEKDIHIVWLNTGGVQGYSPVSHTSSMLEMLGIPYIGHDPLNSSILDSKHVFKHMLNGLGIKTSPFIAWDPSRGILVPQRNKPFKDAFGDYRGPFVIKPVSGRASLHVDMVDSVDELPFAVNETYENTHNLVLIEKYLSGREFCVAIYGYVTHQNGKFLKHANPFAFSEVERSLGEDEPIFTSMDKRPITGDRIKVINGTEEPELKEKLEKLAQLVYLAFNLKTLIRLDIRADENGELNILEVNPKPDLKKTTEKVTSLVCKGLEEYNMSYDDLILGILADRLDFLFANNPYLISHISQLLEPQSKEYITVGWKKSKVS